MKSTRDNIIASAKEETNAAPFGMMLRKDETALEQRIRMLELSLSQMVSRLHELDVRIKLLEDGKGM